MLRSYEIHGNPRSSHYKHRRNTIEFCRQVAPLHPAAHPGVLPMLKNHWEYAMNIYETLWISANICKYAMTHGFLMIFSPDICYEYLWICYGYESHRCLSDIHQNCRPRLEREHKDPSDLPQISSSVICQWAISHSYCMLLLNDQRALFDVKKSSELPEVIFNHQP